MPKPCIELNSQEVHPINSAPYCAWQKASEFKKRKTDKMLRMNIMQPTMSAWALPITFAATKDGSLQLCNTYREVNSQSMKDVYLILQMQECLNWVGEACISSTSDAISGYWLVEIVYSDKEKKTFILHQRLCRCRQMQLGLKKPLSTLQLAIDITQLKALPSWVTWSSSQGPSRSI